MAKKKFNPLSEHGFIGETKSKSKPKPYEAGATLLDYFYERDLSWMNDIFCPDDIKEMVERRLNNNFYERETNTNR